MGTSTQVGGGEELRGGNRGCESSSQDDFTSMCYSKIESSADQDTLNMPCSIEIQDSKAEDPARNKKPRFNIVT